MMILVLLWKLHLASKQLESKISHIKKASNSLEAFFIEVYPNTLSFLSDYLAINYISMLTFAALKVIPETHYHY